jgi:hypothetical protein
LHEIHGGASVLAIYGCGSGKYGLSHALVASVGAGAEYSFVVFGRRYRSVLLQKHVGS